jgi:tetratricopeptide (TPR) repeat protein
MSRTRRRKVDPLDDAERLLLEEQTRRNLEGMQLESAGRTDLAIEQYERNVAERFPGDWPYSRLVSIYERQGAYDEAERVLRRAIDVTREDRRKPAADRRSLLHGLQGRLRLLKKTAQAARTRGAGDGQRGHAFVPLPMLDDR